MSAPVASAFSPSAPVILGCDRRCRRLALLVLLAVWAFALGTTAAAGALWMSPLGAPIDLSLSLKLAVAVMLGGGLLCYAMLGSRSELYFDREERVVREVLHRPGGRIEEVGSWRFDEFRAIEIHDRRDARRMALRAELRLSGENVSIRVAQGGLDAMAALARRVEADLGLPHRRGVSPFHRRGAA